MAKLLFVMAAGAVLAAAPAAAHDTETGFPTRGACEAVSAQTSNAEMERVLSENPQFFSSVGEVRSFLTRAWQCELDESDDLWYIVDYRRQTLGSDWFRRRMN